MNLACTPVYKMAPKTLVLNKSPSKLLRKCTVTAKNDCSFKILRLSWWDPGRCQMQNLKSHVLQRRRYSHPYYPPSRVHQSTNFCYPTAVSAVPNNDDSRRKQTET
mmetsp:Transcript_35888/g.70607  ORF Transcript_35888/g.70607 Transcript_35888/m.70607 type:complete len:106 (-) Transcript_35888:99-416(-)